MTLLQFLLSFIGEILAKVGIGVINHQLETPAEETHVTKNEGVAVDPGGEFFADFNRVPDRNEAAE